MNRPAFQLPVALCLGLAVTFAGQAIVHAQETTRQWPVYVEDSPAQQEMLAQARSLVSQQRMTEAAALYQQMTQEHPRKLAPIDAARYVDAQVAMQLDIAANDALLQAYRQLFETHAGNLLAQIDPASTDAWQDRIAQLQQLMGQYLLTDAGLEAGLQLASLHLESGNPADAQGVLVNLRTHPSYDTRLAQWHWLMAAAQSFQNDDDQAAVHQQAIIALRDAAADPSRRQQLDDMLQSLAQWRSLRLVPSSQQATDAIRPGLEAKLPQVYEASLWQVTLDDSQESSQEGDDQVELPANMNVRGRGNDDKPRYHAIPVERNGVVYVNQPLRIAAMNANSGRVLWQWVMPEPNDLATRNVPFRLFQPDLRSCAISGDALAAVVGRHISMPGRMGAMAQPTQLVMLDARDGRERWRVSPTELQDPPEELNFHGSPIIHQNRVYVLGRRSRMTGFHTQYVFAFDLTSGRELWRRHLASTNAPMNQRSLYPLGQMTLEAGRLFVADNLGAVSCVDALTGQILWLAHGPRMPVSLASATGNSAAASIFMGSPPVLVEQGLLIAPANPGQVAVLLDPRTGLEIRQLDESQWASAEYIFKADGDVYTVGHRVQRFDGKTLQRQWGVALSGGRRVNLQGKAALTGEHLLIPVNNRVLVLDAKRGSLVMQPEIAIHGSLLALESQLVVAGPNRVGGFMTWEDAYERLTTRMSQSPDDPSPAMALAHLAGKSNKLAEMLKAVDQAIAAVNLQARGDASQRQAAMASRKQLFEQIIELARDNPGQAQAGRRGLYDRLAVVTSDLGDELTYHLLLGELFVDLKDYAQAVSHYQFILNDPSLSQQLHTRQGLSRQGGLEARVRLQRLIETNGLWIYTQQEQLAAARLVEMTSPGAQTPAEALIELARQFPVSRSAGPALIAAADRLSQQGNAEQAIRQLRAAYELSSEATVHQKALGRLVTLYAQQGKMHQARSWLMLAARRKIDPLRDGRPVRAEQWLASLGTQQENMSNLPVTGTNLHKPVVLEATRLQPMVTDAATSDARWFITQTPGELQMRMAPRGELAWRMNLDAKDVQLVTIRGDQTLLWLEDRQQLLSLQTVDGQPTWPAVNLGALHEVLGDAQMKLQARSQERRQFEAWMDGGGVVIRNGRLEAVGSQPPEKAMIVINEMVVCIVDGIGRAVGIDRQTGHPLWTRMLSLDQVHHLAMDDQTLAAAGLTGVRVGAQGGALLLIDPHTGELRLDAPIEDKRAMTWLGLGSQGQVVFSTGAELVAHHHQDGRLLWRLPGSSGQFTPDATIMGDQLLVLDTQGQASLIELGQGKVITRMNMASAQAVSNAMTQAQALPSAMMQPTADHWHVATPSQAIRMNRAGQVQWRDGLGQLPGQMIAAQGISQSHVALLLIPRLEQVEAPVNEQPAGRRFNRIVIRNNRPMPVEQIIEAQTPKAYQGRYELLLLDRQTGRIVLSQPMTIQPAMANPTILMLDHAIVLSDDARTLVIPTSKDAQRQ